MSFKRKWNYFKSIFGFILIVLGGIALWNVIQNGTFSILEKIGITNFYWQNIVLIALALLVLMFLGGVSLVSGLKKLIKG